MAREGFPDFPQITQIDGGSRGWVSVKEFAALKGVSERAVQKAISKGRYQVKEVSHPSRKDQVAYLVWSGEPSDELANQKSGEPSDELANQKSGEPSDELANQVTNHWRTTDEPSGEPLANHKSDEPSAELRNQSAEPEEVTADFADQSADCADEVHTDFTDSTDMAIIPQNHFAECNKMMETHRLKPVLRPAEASVTGGSDPDQPLSMVGLNEKAEFEGYPRESREVAYARLEIVKTWISEKQRAKVDGVKIGELEKSFLRQLKTGKICGSATSRLAKDGALTLSMRSIYRWEKSWRDHDGTYPVSLVDKWNRSRFVKDQQYVRTYIKMQAVDPRRHQITDIIRMAQTAVPGFDLSYRTVARIVEAARKDKVLSAALKGKTSWKNEARPHIRRVNDCAPGDRWESDGKTLNVLVMSPFWFHQDKSIRYLVRPVIVAWLDVATWMITGWATWLSESWHLVRTSFVDSMGRAGVPRTVVYDGGGSFHNIWTDPQGFAGRKRETAAVKKARELISKGYPGFYEQFGVEKRVKTIPGNSESKQIEPAWGDIFGEWERQQFAYVGKDFMNRPEWMRMTNLALMKKHARQILTWDEYVASMGDFINEWNNRPRPSLTRADGSVASPIEAYMEWEDSIQKPSLELVEHVNWHPRKLVVQRDGVYLDGLLYRHPAFGCYLGQSMLVEYDERNRWEAVIATASGEKLMDPARLVIPGMHMDDEQSQRAMIDRARYEKQLKAVYLARVNQGDAVTMAEMNSLTHRVDLMLQDQARRQEIEKAAVVELPQQRNRGISFTTEDQRKQGRDTEGGFESIEAEFAECAAVEAEPVGLDDDDLLISEITKDLGNIGLRSTR